MATTETRSAVLLDRWGLAGLRLTARGRLVLFLLAVAVSLPVALAGSQAVAGSPGEPIEVRLHTVAPGETLWQFAAGLAEPGEDLRVVVAELRDLNGMPDSSLQVGQVLVLPRS
ncbi:LysM peptidoglycan-binding domain-containing protein [Isoptericola sediminis]|uniref:LysM peptidoglycan-binding domain-containing protein n=1 Tax=Isoptericola sediminis TaxID=2733572 RepID=A0A849K855_9MICO|nr:LysM peptidoglycan-binding domain-containing protein [Isoptericola sediminis]NNU28219.1 LysM peptidoglycan-binding domain-containing protein [Isoptericola sediminis]